MQGAYPTPGNNLACNTTETITVYVKPGARRSYGQAIRNANGMESKERLAEHSDLTQQVWWIMPAKIDRKRSHPAPFPELLPARLIKLFTFGAAGDFPGEIVADPFYRHDLCGRQADGTALDRDRLRQELCHDSARQHHASRSRRWHGPAHRHPLATAN
jgi:hypothetical protein